MVAADGVAAFLVHRGLRPDAGEVGELPLQLTGPRLERVVPLVPAHGAAAAAARRGARRLPAGDRLRQEHHPLRLDEPHAIAAALRLRRRRVQWLPRRVRRGLPPEVDVRVAAAAAAHWSRRAEAARRRRQADGHGSTDRNPGDSSGRTTASPPRRGTRTSEGACIANEQTVSDLHVHVSIDHHGKLEQIKPIHGDGDSPVGASACWDAAGGAG